MTAREEEWQCESSNIRTFVVFGNRDQYRQRLAYQGIRISLPFNHARSEALESRHTPRISFAV